MARKYNQGFFKPMNPKKYKGDPTKIVYRSGLEFSYMRWLDKTDSVISWASEEMTVSYVSPIDGKRHRYFPDFTIEVLDKDGKRKKYMIEIKPASQCKPPKPQKKASKGYIWEVQEWGRNSAKWEAAKKWCASHNYEFQILTENDLK
jgi:hypothetical protein